jgi:hypothetical protein
MRLIPIRFLSNKALHAFRMLPCPNSDLLWYTFVSIVCGFYIAHPLELWRWRWPVFSIRPFCYLWQS